MIQHHITEAKQWGSREGYLLLWLGPGGGGGGGVLLV